MGIHTKNRESSGFRDASLKIFHFDSAQMHDNVITDLAESAGWKRNIKEWKRDETQNENERVEKEKDRKTDTTLHTSALQ